MPNDLLPLHACLDILDQLALKERPSFQAEMAQTLRGVFLGALRTDPDSIDKGAFIAALARAVDQGYIGWGFDHNEAILFFEDTCHGLTNNSSMEVPQSAWVGQRNSRPYRYKRKTFDKKGFASFDAWLGKQQIRTRKKQLSTTKRPPATINAQMQRNRVVWVDTGEDFWVAVLHPAREIPTLIDKLDALGVGASRVLDDTTEEQQLWFIPTTRTIEVAVVHLTDAHGFEVVEEHTEDFFKSVGLFKWIDSQHGVSVRLDGASDMQRRFAGVSFMLFRQDIHELTAEIVGNELTRRGGMIPYGVDEPNWGAFTSVVEVASYFDLLVPEVENNANLPFIAKSLASYAKSRSPQGWPLIANRMLDGWQPESDDKLLLVERSLLPGFPGDPEKMNRARAWIAKHPTGIARELTN